MVEEDKKVSKYSSGINILNRVDFLWKNCHNYKRNGMFNNWNDELDSVWLELARDLDEKEYYDIDSDGNIILNSEKDKEKIKTSGLKSEFEKFDRKLEILGGFNDSGNLGFNKPTPEMITKRNNQYKLLMEKQLFLARLENKLGKGTSWEDEDEDF